MRCNYSKCGPHFLTPKYRSSDFKIKTVHHLKSIYICISNYDPGVIIVGIGVLAPYFINPPILPNPPPFSDFVHNPHPPPTFHVASNPHPHCTFGCLVSLAEWVIALHEIMDVHMSSLSTLMHVLCNQVSNFILSVGASTWMNK